LADWCLELMVRYIQQLIQVPPYLGGKEPGSGYGKIWTFKPGDTQKYKL
jgi:hypothetical protein